MSVTAGASLRSFAILCILAICAPPALRADATIRYQSTITPSTLLAGVLPPSTTVRVKGVKAWGSDGGLTFIIDGVKQEITLLDSDRKTYATVPVSQYAAKTVAAVSPDASGLNGEAAAMVKDMMAKMKTKVDSKLTGRTDVILGVQAFEREIDIAIEMPMPGGMPGMSMKMAEHVWSATPAETSRVPALRELAALNQWQKIALSEGDFLKSLPGVGDIAPIMDEMYKDQTVILRTSIEMDMSSMTGGAGVSVPAMQMKMEAVELSDAPVDDALFQNPKDYAQAPFEEVMKSAIQGMLPGAHTGAAATAPAGSGGAAPVPLPAGVQAYVPNLSPLRQEDPAYPEEARTQNVHGSVDLLLTIDPKGNVTQAEALTGPKLLRKPAIDSVMKWQFRPVLRNGAPVAAMTDQTVDFSHGENGEIKMQDVDLEADMAADDRLERIKQALPRTPGQKLADLEQDSGGGDASRRYYALDDMAKAALEAGATDKAVTYATELLTASSSRPKDWHTGDAIHAGNTVLGLMAVDRGDIAKAGEYLLASAKTDGSPVLGSFGPSMKLAKALLAKGDRTVVLQYLDLCRGFWKSGGQALDEWAHAITDGTTPDFGMSLR